MSVMSLEDTGQLQQMAEAYDRIKRDPRRPGHLDRVLAAAALAAIFVVGLCVLMLILAPNEYSVERGRIVLTLAAAGTCVSPVMLGLWGVTRVHRKRHEQLMEKLDRIRCDCPGGVDGVDPKDLAMRSFETGRRIGRREADG